jgi:hypothetical protein
LELEKSFFYEPQSDYRNCNFRFCPVMHALLGPKKEALASHSGLFSLLILAQRLCAATFARFAYYFDFWSIGDRNAGLAKLGDAFGGFGQNSRRYNRLGHFYRR